MRRALLYFGVPLIVLLLAWLHYVVLMEVRGPVEPFYQGAVHADQWASPWPTLLMADALALVVIVIIVYVNKRR